MKFIGLLKEKHSQTKQENVTKYNTAIYRDIEGYLLQYSLEFESYPMDNE